MARRKKKVNPRILIILGVLLALVLAGGGYYVYRQLPKDPEPFFRQAEKDMEAENYRDAVSNFGLGVHHQIQQGINDAKRLYDMAMAQLAHASKTPDLSDPRRRQYRTKGFQSLQGAVQIDPTFVEPRRQLVEMRLGWLRSNPETAG